VTLGIYLDYQATTPLDSEVLEAMLPWMVAPSNAHATEHAWGRNAEAAVERAREQVAAAVNCDPDGVIFTSNATEAANIVLRSFGGQRKRLLISTIEHPCVAETAMACAAKGTQVTHVSVDQDGLVDLDELAEQLEDCDLVSVMAVNNEIGTVQPINAIAALCRSAGVPFHTDAAQALGRVPIDMSLGISFVSLSGHSMVPKGLVQSAPTLPPSGG
jgi:cysteine desulfurase